jgi:hypothetical protein
MERGKIRQEDRLSARALKEIIMTIEEGIRANAELVITSMREQLGVLLDYDEKSVEWLDGYIERNREQFEPDELDRIVSVLGSFLGECIRIQFGGEWVEVEGQWAVRIGNGPGSLTAFPFNKVWKHFEQGIEEGESVAGFYKSIPALLTMEESGYGKPN